MALKLLDEVPRTDLGKVIDNCGSSRLRNCDAQFPEIFSSNLFRIMSQQERKTYLRQKSKPRAHVVGVLLKKKI